MEFSPRFVYSATRVFNSNDTLDAECLRRELSLDSNNVFRRSLVIEVNDDEVEIPAIAREHFERLVLENINYPPAVGIKRIILPLYDNAPSQERKTFDSIIKQLFTNVGREGGWGHQGRGWSFLCNQEVPGLPWGSSG